MGKKKTKMGKWKEVFPIPMLCGKVTLLIIAIFWYNLREKNARSTLSSNLFLFKYIAHGL